MKDGFKAFLLGILVRVGRFKKKIKRRFRLIWVFSLVATTLRYRISALYNGLLLNSASAFEIHNLRRNTHRIEKGLAHPNPRKVFGRAYIQETVDLFRAAYDCPSSDRGTIEWSDAVLAKYFLHCEHEAEIAVAHAKFKAVGAPNAKPGNVPYVITRRPETDVTYDGLLNLSRRRTSVRKYQEKKVSRELISRALDIALQAPSACNRQAFRFRFYNDIELAHKISQVPGGVSGYLVPSIVVLTGRYCAYFEERDFNAPVIDASLVAMGFMLALETLALSSVCINWPNLVDREKQLRTLIDLDKDEFVVMMIGVGYPADDVCVPYSQKKYVADILV